MQLNSDNEPSTSDKKSAPKETVARRVQRFFFGDDIFVSYARHDSDYALTLADELTKRNISCFLDQWGTPPGEELPRELVDKLNKSEMLVIVGTSRAAASNNVMREVLEFKKTKRPIIPVTFVAEEDFIRIRNGEIPQNLKGTLEAATWYSEVAGIATTVESQIKLKPRDANEAVAPSPRVVTRIVNAKGFLSRSRRLRKIFWTTFASVVALLVIAGVTVYVSQQQVREAKAEQVAAENKTRLADHNRVIAESARDVADRARAEAEGKTREAQDDLRATREQLEKASADLLTANKLTKAEQTKAERARNEADRQSKNAVARQTATRADSLRSQAVQRDRDWAEMLQESVLLSIESAKRLSAIGMSSADSMQSLRNSLALLPRAVRTAVYKQKVEDALLTPDGKYVITKDEDNVLRVLDAASDNQVSQEIKLDNAQGDIAFNSDRTLVATPLAGRLAVWDLPAGTLQWEKKRQGKNEFVMFSPDGKQLAASTTVRAHPGSDEEIKSIMIWDARTGEKITEVRYDNELTGVALRPHHNQIALSLDKPLHQSDNATKVNHIVQIWNLTDPATIVVSANPKESLYHLTFNYDGRLLAASSKGTATIWELGAGKELTSIKDIEIAPDDTGYIQKIDFSPDGKTIGTWGQDGTMQTWDVLTGRRLWESGTRDADDWDYFKPYVVLRDGHGIRVVDVRTGKDVARVIQSEDIRGSDYAAESDRLIIYHRKHVRIYDTGSAQEEVRLSHRRAGRIAAFNANRQFAAIVSGNEVVVWDVMIARQVARFSAIGEIAYPVLSPDGSRLAAWCDDEAVYIWKVRGEPQVWRIPNIKNTSIVKLTFSSHGRFLAIETPDSDDKVLDLVGQEEIATGDHASFSPDESFIVLQHDRTARVLDLRSGSEVAVLPLPPSHDYIPPAFSPDGTHMAMAIGHNETLKVFEMLDLRKGFELTLPDYVVAYDYSPDGKYILATGGLPGEEVLQVWETATGKPVTPLLNFEKTVKGLFSPNGKHFITVTFPNRESDGEVRVWEIAGGRPVACAVYKDNLNIVKFSLDGRYLIISAGDDPARVFDLDTGRMVAELVHEGPVTYVSVSPDGSLMVTAGSDGTARVWQVGEWREVSRITQDGGVVLANFSADGRRLATLGIDMTARVWILSEQELIERACRSLHHNLSPEEWQNNFGSEVYAATCYGLPPASNRIESRDGDCNTKTDIPITTKHVAGVSPLRQQRPSR